jgi:hypothetical protein
MLRVRKALMSNLAAAGILALMIAAGDPLPSPGAAEGVASGIRLAQQKPWADEVIEAIKPRQGQSGQPGPSAGERAAPAKGPDSGQQGSGSGAQTAPGGGGGPPREGQGGGRSTPAR